MGVITATPGEVFGVWGGGGGGVSLGRGGLFGSIHFHTMSDSGYTESHKLKDTIPQKRWVSQRGSHFFSETKKENGNGFLRPGVLSKKET